MWGRLSSRPGGLNNRRTGRDAGCAGIDSTPPPRVYLVLREDSVNRNDLARAIYSVHGGLSQAESQKIVDMIFMTIRDRLLQGEKVLLSGFGCFRVKSRKERRGVNPHTGESIVVSGRRAVVFKPSRGLKSV